MKKFFICIIITIFVIVLSVFIYKKVNDNNVITHNNIILSEQSDFILYIDNIEKGNSNVKVYGVISSGKIALNNEISIEGLGKKGVDTKVVKLEVNNRETETAKAGDNVCLTLDSNVNEEDIQKGEAIIIPGTTKPIYNFKVKIIESDIELDKIIEKVDIFNINYDIKCSLKIISNENKEVKISLEVPIAVKKDLEILLKNENDVIAKAVIIED